MSERYPLCQSPIEIGGLRFRNRVTRTAHGTGYGVDGKVSERLIAYHEARARGGAGSLLMETSGVHWSSPGPLRALTDEIVPGWEQIATRLHAIDQTRVLAQLWHGGAQAQPPDGSASWAASAIADPIHGRVAQAMTKAMIDELVEGFANAAARAKRAGLDGVELHGAHTYLVCSFLSPMTNLREDDYGGSLENRVRFAREVLAAIRSAAGHGFVVGIRINASEGAEGGIEPPEARQIRELLEAQGAVDYVNVSMGGYHNFGKMIGAMHEPHGYVATSVPVTRGARVPTIVTGRMLTMAEAEQALADGAADLVSFVRAMLADPDLPRKSFEGRERDVRPCIGCNEGCVGRRFAIGAAVGETGCTVNPDAGFEYRQKPLQPASPRRTVLVAGAGPAGLEAARTAALRGHRVLLHDSSPEPGGLVRFSRAAPHRNEIGKICDWLWAELERLDVTRSLESPVDERLVSDEGAEVVIVATGSLPRRDGIQRMRPAHRVPGVAEAHVVTPLEVLGPDAPRVEHAVVFDDLGNYQAVGAAEHLLAQGVEVTFATSFGELAPDLFRSFQRDAVAQRLERYESFTLATRSSIEAVMPDSVALRHLDSGRETTVPTDLVVMMTGFESQTQLVRELAGLPVETRLVGDALAPLLMPHAIATGYAAGAEV